MKQLQVDLVDVRENDKQVMHEYAIDNQVYVKIIGIYQKLDYKKQGPNRITEVFTNGTFRVQWVQVNKRID